MPYLFPQEPVQFPPIQLSPDTRQALITPHTKLALPESIHNPLFGQTVSIVGKGGDKPLSSSVALDICEDWVSLRVILLEVNTSNFDQRFQLVPDEDVTRNRNIVIRGAVLERDLRLDPENQRCAGK
jgi:hypothetical protein